MSEITSVGPSHAAAGPAGRREATPARVSELPGRQETTRGDDRVELSSRARFINRLREMPDVRQDRVDAARQAIQDPEFANDERVTVAVERLLEELQLDQGG